MARLNTQPVLAGVAIGAVTAIALALLPATALESIVSRTHLASVMVAAQPPLGTKARLLISAIPLVLFSVAGLVAGLVMGGRKRVDDYGDYGAYSDFGADDDPVADPFAAAHDMPIMAGTYEAPPQPEPVAEAEPDLAPAPAQTFAAPALMPAPPPAAANALDSATSRDLAEIADAVVRMSARLEAIEARLDARVETAPGASPDDLPARLAKIARSLDEAS